MEYSIRLLEVERNKLKSELLIALNQEPKDWDVIIRNERLLEDLEKAIEMLYTVNN